MNEENALYEEQLQEEKTPTPAPEEPAEAPAANADSKELPYHERYYLRYREGKRSTAMDLDGTKAFLQQLGFDGGELRQAREGKNRAEDFRNANQGKGTLTYCSYCGTEISGVEFYRMPDGRTRCNTCSSTVVKSKAEVEEVLQRVITNLGNFFGATIDVPISVEVLDERKLKKKVGAPLGTKDSQSMLILGVAINDKKKKKFSILLENGAPRISLIATFAHELTHIWQYLNWNDKAIRKKYGKNMRLEIYEGMAKWVEIQYAYLINEPATAKREEIITSYRDDEYGRGFLRYRANYPFSLGTVITKPTPFMNLVTPLDPEFCGPITVKLPTDGINPGDTEGGKPTPGGEKPTPGTIKGPIERNPGSLNRYAYSLLNEDEKSVYNTLLNAINSFTTEITAFDAAVTETQIQKIIDYVQRDHPELFWFQHGATFYFDTVTRIVNRLTLTYCMTQEEAKRRQQKIDAATKSFLTSVTDSMSDYEATLHIYENIIKLVDYDTIGLERQKRTSVTPDVPDDLRSIYGVFVNKKAVCAGYAKALQYLLNLCGIECTYVTSDTHAWNLIKLEGDYYHMDVTWGDGSDTKKDKAQTSAISYDCFCITTAELARLDAHTPDSKYPLPNCTATKCNYHRRHGLYFETVDLDKVRTVVCGCAKQNKLDISFKFSSPEVFAKAKKQLVDEGKFREAMQFASLKTSVKLNSSFSYSLREDRLSIAFFMNKL